MCRHFSTDDLTEDSFDGGEWEVFYTETKARNILVSRDSRVSGRKRISKTIHVDAVPE